MMEKIYDVFIAYHGSFDKIGSKTMADKLFEFLVSRNLKPFYFPFSGRDVFKANIIDAIKSKTFILVCNDNIHISTNGSLDKTNHYELCTEIDSFYALTQLGNDVSVSDAKVFLYGDFSKKIRKGDEAKFHELFANRTHFYLESNDEIPIFESIYNWIMGRINTTNTIKTQWKNKISTKELKQVFPKRSMMSQKCDLPNLIANAKHIRCIGISNSEITVKLDPEAMLYALENGAIVEIVFLDPVGKYTALREIEEGHRKDRIKEITENNIEHATTFKKSLPPEIQKNYKLYIYDQLPRVNLIIIDDKVILQYYANAVAGISNPCFLVEKQEYSPIYEFCINNYVYLLGTANVLEVI